MSHMYVEEDVVKNLEESAKLQRAYANFFDLIVVNESWEDTYIKIMNGLDDVENEPSWVPAKWVYSWKVTFIFFDFLVIELLDANATNNINHYVRYYVLVKV